MKNYDGDGGANHDLDELERERNGGLTDQELDKSRRKNKKRQVSTNNYQSTVVPVTAYRCRDGQLFESSYEAETYEQLVARREYEHAMLIDVTRGVRIDNIQATGGFFKRRVEARTLEQVEAYALAWKEKHYGYDPTISTIKQLSGPDGPWSCELTRWSKC